MKGRGHGAMHSGVTSGNLEQMTARLEKHVRLNWPQCDKLVLRSRGPFVYVLAGTREDPQAEPWCRLRPLGSEDAWEFAYFTYSTEKYEPSFLPNGSPAGTPEECFDCAAAVLLVGAI